MNPNEISTGRRRTTGSLLPVLLLVLFMPPPQPPKRQRDYLAAVLSYLIPGMGQVIQGRVGKGVLYFLCLYALFFYGMALGQWKNVWIPDGKDNNDNELPAVRVPLLGVEMPGVLKNVMYRKEFAGQFWMGIAAWPAIVQYATLTPTDPDDMRPAIMAKPKPKANPIFGRYMQAPTEAELNDIQRNGDRRWDLGWVYTVIAGLLNILVIYDALSGPVVKDEEAEQSSAPKNQEGGA
jgi:TM2 domain-containing membrane protein YozV